MRAYQPIPDLVCMVGTTKLLTLLTTHTSSLSNSTKAYVRAMPTKRQSLTVPQKPNSCCSCTQKHAQRFGTHQTNNSATNRTTHVGDIARNVAELTCSAFTTDVMFPTRSDLSSKASSVGKMTPPICALPPCHQQYASYQHCRSYGRRQQDVPATQAHKEYSRCTALLRQVCKLCSFNRHKR